MKASVPKRFSCPGAPITFRLFRLSALGVAVSQPPLEPTAPCDRAFSSDRSLSATCHSNLSALVLTASQPLSEPTAPVVRAFGSTRSLSAAGHTSLSACTLGAFQPPNEPRAPSDQVRVLLASLAPEPVRPGQIRSQPATVTQLHVLDPASQKTPLSPRAPGQPLVQESDWRAAHSQQQASGTGRTTEPVCPQQSGD